MLILIISIILIIVAMVISNNNFNKEYTGANDRGVFIRCWYCQRFHGPICKDKLAGLPATPIPPRPKAPLGDRPMRKRRK